MDTPSFFEHLDTTIKFAIAMFIIGAVMAVTIRLFYKGKRDADRLAPNGSFMVAEISHTVMKLGVTYEDADTASEEEIRASAFLFLDYILDKPEIPMQISYDRDIRARIHIVTFVFHGAATGYPRGMELETLEGWPDIVKLTLYRWTPR